MNDLEGAGNVRKIIQRMQSSGAGVRVSIEDRKAWFKGVITHYTQQCVEWRRFDGPRPILSRSVTAMVESYNVKTLLVHLREKLNCESPTSTIPPGGREGGPPSVKEKRKREKDQKRKAEADKRRKSEQQNTRDAAAGQASSSQSKLTAWPNRPATIEPEEKWVKFRTATKGKYPSHCHAYLFGNRGCTKSGCKNGSHSAPADWQAYLKEQGF